MGKAPTFTLAWITVFLMSCAGVFVLADDWPAPQIREVFSAGRSHFVRVTPGQSWGDVFGFAGSPKGSYAKAESFQRREDGTYVPATAITLVNPIAPVEYFVTESGHLVTLDNWHNRGYGKVFALYSSAGVLIQSYELAELFSREEIEGFEHSESSILWRKGPSYLQRGQESLYVSIDGRGGSVSFNTVTGEYEYCEWRGQEFACRRSNSNRSWQPFNPSE